jgi:Dyp-type peroxidase family
MRAADIEYADMQGLVRFGHGALKDACYLLLAVADRQAARHWLRNAPVTTAEALPVRPDVALQVAFTSAGLAAMGLPEPAVEGFSDEFLEGMAGDANRSRRLGDVGDNAPEQWDWGGPSGPPHLLVMLFARAGGLEAWETRATGPHFAGAFRLLKRLTTEDIGDIEPFGFADGLSQPRLDWEQALPLDGRDRLDYSNLSALGDFLLGYRNEYGEYTGRPLLNAAFDRAAAVLPPAEDAPHRRDLGRNGSYLVFRQLQQHVRAFWQFADRASGHDPERRLALAEAMVGRRQDGSPLVPASGRRIEGVGSDPADLAANGFLYDDDQKGHRCPFGAHVRRANPRTGDLPVGSQPLVSRLKRILGFGDEGFHSDLIASARFHRLLRRGREYGGALPLEEALADGPDEDRGLHFIGLVANIGRQFEFVQNSWIENAKFDGLGDEADPLLGNRVPLVSGGRTDGFSRPRAGASPERLDGLPRFVTVRGGAYFFMPGLRALRYIAEAGA